MKTRTKLLAFLIVVFLLIDSVTSTYARYVSAASANISTDFARWQISVNNTNITSNYSSSIEFTPIIDSNPNVAAGKVAPGSTGYFDIVINPENVDVSFDYTISITKAANSEISDLNIVNYAIVDPSTPNVINKISSNGSNITNTLTYNNSVSNFKFNTFIVRIFFVWDDTTGTMTDAQDTAIGNKAANGETINFNFIANLQFQQHI